VGCGAFKKNGRSQFFIIVTPQAQKNWCFTLCAIVFNYKSSFLCKAGKKLGTEQNKFTYNFACCSLSQSYTVVKRFSAQMTLEVTFEKSNFRD